MQYLLSPPNGSPSTVGISGAGVSGLVSADALFPTAEKFCERVKNHAPEMNIDMVTCTLRNETEDQILSLTIKSFFSLF